VAWRKLTQEQLLYVLTLLSLFDDKAVVKTYMFIRLNGIHVEGNTLQMMHEQPHSFRCWVRTKWWKPRTWFTLEPWQVQSVIRQFDFIEQFDGMDVRLERIHGCRAVDDILDGYPFGDYLYAETYYQQALMTGESRMIEQLARLLYLRRGIVAIDHFPWRWVGWKHPLRFRLSPAEQMGTLMWFAHVKSEFAERWPYFFRRVSGEMSEPEIDLIGAMNAQIRALTEGDLTKEAAIRRMPCWRALTELNEKAREAKEFHEKYDKK